MHELSITQSMMDIVLDQAKAADAKKVTRINIVIGEMSGVVSDCIQFYFDFLKKGNVAEEAVLDFKSVPVELKCRDCQAVFNPNGSAWVCPSCQGNGLEVVKGQESYVESIEVE